MAEDPATNSRIIVQETSKSSTQNYRAPPELSKSPIPLAEEMATEIVLKQRQHFATVEDQLRNAVQTIKTLREAMPEGKYQG